MHHHDDSPSLFTLVQFAREHRKHPTASERIFWRAVCHKRLGVRVRRQHPMHPYIVDFYVAAYRLVIELDGGAHASDAARLADARRDAEHVRRARPSASGRPRRALARLRHRDRDRAAGSPKVVTSHAFANSRNHPAWQARGRACRERRRLARSRSGTSARGLRSRARRRPKSFPRWAERPPRRRVGKMA